MRVTLLRYLSLYPEDRMRHLLSTKGLSKEWLDELFRDADRIRNDFKYPFYDNRQIMISFFAEPSTRTRFSFEAAATHLGMRILSESNASVASSLRKGESLKDTFRTLSQYGQIIVCRHPDSSWPEAAEKYSRVPVINAGSGDGEHPTQALLDLYTIKKEIGRLDNLRVMLCGDLQHGRTVHSLVELLKMYGADMYLIPAKNLTNDHDYNLPMKYYSGYDRWHTDPEMAEGFLPIVDVVYMTRMQTERHYESAFYSYFRLNADNVKKMRQDATILHPLPRGDEISEDVDDDPRAAYHERQMRNGLYVRAALLKLLSE